MAEVTEMEGLPSTENLAVIDKMLNLAKSMMAFATSARQLTLMEATVADMQADRDRYAERVERLESSNGQFKKDDREWAIGGSVVELEGVPNRENLAVIDKMLALATSMTAFARSPSQLQLMESNVAVMQADRDNYAAQVERLENRDK